MCQTTDRLLKSLISLFTDGCVLIMQWEALHMTATTQLFSPDVFSNFGALYNEDTKGSCGAVLYLSWWSKSFLASHCALERKHSLDFALDFALV